MKNAALVHRIVNNNQNARLNYYKRKDGIFFYTKDEISEWDASPPIWVKRKEFGLFKNLQQAIDDSRKIIQSMNSYKYIKYIPSKEWRPLGDSETKLLNHLISNTDLSIDYKSALALTIDSNRSIKFLLENAEARKHKFVSRGSYNDGLDKSGAIVDIVLSGDLSSISSLVITKVDDTPIEVDPYEIEIAEIKLISTP